MLEGKRPNDLVKASLAIVKGQVDLSTIDELRAKMAEPGADAGDLGYAVAQELCRVIDNLPADMPDDQRLAAAREEVIRFLKNATPELRDHICGVESDGLEQREGRRFWLGGFYLEWKVGHRRRKPTLAKPD